MRSPSESRQQSPQSVVGGTEHEEAAASAPPAAAQTTMEPSDGYDDDGHLPHAVWRGRAPQGQASWIVREALRRAEAREVKGEAAGVGAGG